MNWERSTVSRRDFLKQGAAVGLGMLTGGRVNGSAWAASKERVTILSSSVTDTLNPYNHSGSLIYGMWQHIFEPLVEVSYTRCATPESWPSRGNSRGKTGCFIFVKAFAFTTARRLQRKTLFFPSTA